MSTVGIGLLGAGFVSNFYAKALQHVRHQEIRAVCGRDPGRTNAFAKQWDIPHAVRSVREVVERDDVDLVLIGLPHHLHVEAVGEVAAAGKALVCTKPLGRNAQEARECLRAVEAAGVWHGYAETELFVPAIARAKQLVEDGAVGQVYWVRMREAHGSPHAHALDRELMGGGPMRGVGIHGVAVGRWFLDGGVPQDVFAYGARLVRSDVSGEDSAIALARYPDGRFFQVEAGWGHQAGLDVRTEIHGSTGYIATDHTGQTGIRAYAGESAGYVLEKAASSTGWISPVPREEWAYGYHAELDHFVHAFLAGRPPMQTLRDGVIDNAVVDAAYQSMATGLWITVHTGLLDDSPDLART